MANERYSCRYLESGMSFYSTQITACGVIHHGVGMAQLAPHTGGPLPAELIAANRAKIIEENQHGGHIACRECPNLVRKEWPEPDGMIRWLGITHFDICNIQCDFCWLQWSSESPKAPGKRATTYDLAPIITELVVGGKIAKDAIIDWGGGGEPTIMPEFDQMYTLLAQHGTTQWLHTNAVRMPASIANNDSSLSNLKVLCSVDSGSPATYLEVKKKDNYEQVWKNLALYRQRGAIVVAKYIVQDNNHDRANLEAFLQRAKEVEVQVIQPDIDHRYPDPKPEIIDALAYLRCRAGELKVPVQFGSTGVNSALEFDVVGRVQRAFEKMNEERLAEFLTSRSIYAKPHPAVGAREYIENLEKHVDGLARNIERIEYHDKRYIDHLENTVVLLEHKVKKLPKERLRRGLEALSRFWGKA